MENNNDYNETLAINDFLWERIMENDDIVSSMQSHKQGEMNEKIYDYVINMSIPEVADDFQHRILAYMCAYADEHGCVYPQYMYEIELKMQIEEYEKNNIV